MYNTLQHSLHQLGRCLRRSSRSVLGTAMLLLSPTISAATSPYSGFSSPIDFSLSLINSDIDLQSQDATVPVSLERISISIYTIEEPWAQLGFITGSSYLSTRDDPVTAGMNLSGYHAGLALRSTFGNNPVIGFHANYLYQETKDELANQAVTLSWHEWTVGLTGKIILGQRLGLSAGWNYHALKARRRASGDINDTQSMDLDSGAHSLLELEWIVQPGGRVGLILQSGNDQRTEFRFAQTFR